MYASRVSVRWIVAWWLVAACGAPAADPGVGRDERERWPGGDTTVEERSSRAFSLPARNLDGERRAHFAVGNNLFADNWVTAPSSTSARDGLGPRFDATSCSGCHLHDGRGRIEDDGRIVSAVVRTSASGGGAHPVYGSQLQRRAVLGLNAEGTASARAIEENGLRHFVLALGDAAVIDPDMRTSLRVAPHIVGLGLLEAIDEASLLARADESDRDGDGVSGRPNRVVDLRTGAMALGRFGWKANQPSIEQQVASALAGDIGITSSLVPIAECAASDVPCLDVADGGTPEISDELLGFLVLYARTLAVPAARDFDDATVLRGRAVFGELGCAGCHVPSHVTGDSDIPALAHQTIWPYTDLLLHDMGEGLSDGRPDGEATDSEWRTPPLWGIGLVPAVNGHATLLHDGRARSIDEAIRWHGGEADPARARYEALPQIDRDALTRFVASL